MNLTREPISARHLIISCTTKHLCCFSLLCYGGCDHQDENRLIKQSSANIHNGMFSRDVMEITRASLMRITKPLIFARQIGYYLSLVRKVYNDNKYSQRGWFYIDKWGIHCPGPNFKSDFEELRISTMQARTQNVFEVQARQTLLSWAVKKHKATYRAPLLSYARPSRVFDAKQSSREILWPLIYCLKTLHGTQPRDWQFTLAEELIVWFVYQWSFEWKRESNKMSPSVPGDWLIGWPVTPNVYTSRFAGANQAGVNFSLVCLQNLSNIVWI